MSNYIYTNGELINVNSLSHADPRRRAAANSAKTAYLSSNRGAKASKTPGGASRSSETIRSKSALSNTVAAVSSIPSDIKDYVKLFAVLGLAYTEEAFNAVRACKNAGYTPSELLTILSSWDDSAAKKVPNAVRKLFNLALYVRTVSPR